MKRSRCITGWLALMPLLLGVFTRLGVAGGSGSAEYAGSDTCKGCHHELFRRFEATSHYKTMLETRGGPAHQGCEACHGAGADHVNSRGDVTKIFSFKGVDAKKVSDRCLECHSKENHVVNSRRSAHHVGDVSCTDCHSVHHAKADRGQYLMTQAQPELCYRCHQEIKSQFMRPFRHRIQEGLLQCSDCHNEHGAERKGLRASTNQDQVCFKCHIDKQGPFMFEHMPVKTEGCTSCHQPHGASSPRMLTRADVNMLCLDCHTQSRSARGIPRFHNQAQKFQACTLCHTAIHGSNADPTLLR